MATKKELEIIRGKTFELDVFWSNRDVIVRKPIAAISYALGAPRLTVTGHGMASGMAGFVTLVDGPDEINEEDPSNPRLTDANVVTVIDQNTVEFNAVTPVRENGDPWDAYVAGGFLCYYAPMDLSGVVARVDFYDKPGGTVWASSQAANAPLDIVSVTVDAANKYIRIRIEEEDTDALVPRKGVCEMEVETPDGTVRRLKLTSTSASVHDPVVVLK
jgi:hypothetical protein